MEIKTKKGQFSAVEILLVVILFTTTFVFFSNTHISTSQNFKLSTSSSISSIYQSNNYRTKTIDEDLSNPVNTQDWSTLENILDKKYKTYNIKILNKTTSKTVIKKCTQSYQSKIVSEQVISTKGNDKYEFRRIRLEI